MSSTPTVPDPTPPPLPANPSTSSLPTPTPARSPQDLSSTGSTTGTTEGPRIRAKLKKMRRPPSRIGTVPLMSAVDSTQKGVAPLKRSMSAGSAEPSGRANHRPFGVSLWVARFVGGNRGQGTPRSRSGTPTPPDKILFYHKHEPHYGFTNFSYHPIKYEGKEYPTSEHLFQSFKFPHRPGLAEHIRTCSSRPSVAFSEARRFAPEVRSDWSKGNIDAMDITIYLKFTQHKDLRQELLGTGEAELIENSDRDAFWGCGADGKGKNELGKALVRLRTRLREEGP